MNRWFQQPFRPRLILALAVVVVSSCGDEDVQPASPEPDPTGAAALVQQANLSLERNLYYLHGSNVDHPRDLDFREAHRLYHDALELDPDNLDAHFGVGVTSLLVLTIDEEVDAAFDEWRDYLDNHTPFELPSGAGKPLGVPLGLPSGAELLRLPFDLVPACAIAQARTPMLDADPQISRIQVILRDRVLPLVDPVREHLERVAQDPQYTFTVTPRMQGDDEETPREIDATDILALRAACSLLAAACRITVSYELGFAAFDSTNLVRNLARGSGWLALTPGGRADMGLARTAFLQATEDVERSLRALRDETDVQSDDVIKVGGDLSDADVDSILANIPSVRGALSDGYTRVDDWDNDDSTAEIALEISLGSWFVNPVPDWKELLPAYDVSTERRTGGNSRYAFQNACEAIQVTTQAAGYYSGYYDFYGPGNGYFFGREELRVPLILLIESRYAAMVPPGSCGGNGYGSVSFYGDLAAGVQTVSACFYLSVYVSSCVVVPVIRWQAERFEDWTFPDPTMHGLLPGIGSTGELLSTFGVGPEDWEREWVIDVGF